MDLDRPGLSQLLLCAANDERCAVHPHPGPAAFTSPDDRNYQRLLAYIHSSGP